MYEAKLVADAEERFGMSEEEIAAGTEAIVEVVDGASLGCAVEIYQDVVS
jgi:hypothetical protein